LFFTPLEQSFSGVFGEQTKIIRFNLTLPMIKFTYNIFIKFIFIRKYMKKHLVLVALVAITNLYASDIYNISNGQLTIPSVNVAGTNYNNVVINVGGIVKIGGTGGFELQNINKNFYSKPRTIIISGQDYDSPPNLYVMTLTFSPNADTTFESKAVNVIDQNISFTANGIFVGSVLQKNYFTKGDLNTQVGFSDSGSYSVYSNQNPRTKNTTIGDFGFSSAGVNYKDSTKKAINYYSVFNYSLEQSSDGITAYACNIENQFDPLNANGVVQTTKVCVQVDNSGTLLGGVNAVLKVNNRLINLTGSIQ